MKVVATEEGTGRNEGKLGAPVFQGTDDGKDILVNVGSGLSDAPRETFWETQDRLLGMVAEVRADAVHRTPRWNLQFKVSKSQNI